MRPQRLILGLVLASILAVGMTGPSTAHETETIDGYELTFGGEDDPLITGERMWLQLEIVDNELGESVEDQADSLEMFVQKSGAEKTELDVSESHGDPGVYEAAVIFTEPGEYVIHVEGSIEGSEIHTHFETEIEDHTRLEYPGEDANATESEDAHAADHETNEAGVSSVFSVGIATIGVIAVIGAVLVRQRR